MNQATPQRREIVEALTSIRTLAEAEASGPLLVTQPTPVPYPLRALLSHATLLREPSFRPGPGVPLTLELRLVAASSGCQPIVNAVVSIWHHDCRGALDDGDHRDEAGESEHLLRNMQVSDSDGCVRLPSIYPGAQADGQSRIHLRIFLNDTHSVRSIASTDVLLPSAVTALVHRHPPYRPTRHFVATPSADGRSRRWHALQRLSGDIEHGFAGSLTLAISC
jgi:hypothetical protein